MINLFRKIRQGLLSENKFSKYLIYAIGEIILGILIALYINNINERDKSKTIQKELVELLILDLTNKNQEVANDISTFKSFLKDYQEFRYNWSQNSIIDEDNLNDVIHTFTQDQWFFNENTPTYRNSSNSELWKSLPDSLTRKISELYYVNFGYMDNYTAKYVDYSSHCKLNFLMPKGLLATSEIKLDKNKEYLENVKTILDYISLFELHLKRMEKQWINTQVEIEALKNELKIYSGTIKAKEISLG